MPAIQERFSSRLQVIAEPEPEVETSGHQRVYSPTGELSQDEQVPELPETFIDDYYAETADEEDALKLFDDLQHLPLLYRCSQFLSKVHGLELETCRLKESIDAEKQVRVW